MPADGDRPARPVRSVVEPIEPHPEAFRASDMAAAGPGVPERFDWRGTTYVVTEVLASWRETENYTGAARDHYVKRHAYRVRTASGEVMVLSAARGARDRSARWVLRRVEEA
jgi:hypothetical protein